MKQVLNVLRCDAHNTVNAVYHVPNVAGSEGAVLRCAQHSNWQQSLGSSMISHG